MPKKVYGWGAGEIPEISPHSRAKHRILREYVQRYIEVLTATPGMEVFRLTLVDGFAGGGEYRDQGGLIRPGSPLILLDAVREAEARVNAARTKQLRIEAEHIFVEKDRAVARCLEEVLRKRGDEPRTDGPISLICGTFEEQLDVILTRVKRRGRARRAIFVLDQYGYTGVPVPLIKRIFDELPNAEVFLTLAVGWITAYLPNARAAVDKLQFSPEMIRRLAELNDDSLDLGDANRRPDLLAIQKLLHYVFTSEVGSRFYTPFFIVSRESNRPYWFLHMANNERANDVVKVLHWEIENHFEHFGGAGLTMLGYDPDADPSVTRQTCFLFDDAAKSRTQAALMQELPARLSNSRPEGITFGELFQSLCNETPATRRLIADAVRDLCVDGELEKRGGEGERRAPTTLPHDDDIVRIARQGRLFSASIRPSSSEP